MRLMLKPNSGSISAVFAENDCCFVLMSLSRVSRCVDAGRDESVHDIAVVEFVGLVETSRLESAGIRSLRRVVFLSLLVQVLSFEYLSKGMSSEFTDGDVPSVHVLFNVSQLAHHCIDLCIHGIVHTPMV